MKLHDRTTSKSPCKGEIKDVYSASFPCWEIMRPFATFIYVCCKLLFFFQVLNRFAYANEADILYQYAVQTSFPCCEITWPSLTWKNVCLTLLFMFSVVKTVFHMQMKPIFGIFYVSLVSMLGFGCIIETSLNPNYGIYLDGVYIQYWLVCHKLSLCQIWCF